MFSDHDRIDSCFEFFLRLPSMLAAGVGCFLIQKSVALEARRRTKLHITCSSFGHIYGVLRRFLYLDRVTASRGASLLPAFSLALEQSGYDHSASNLDVVDDAHCCSQLGRECNLFAKTTRKSSAPPTGCSHARRGAVAEATISPPKCPAR